MKNLFKFFVCIFLFANLESNLYPQLDNTEFENISTEQGLSSASVWCITQDSQGFLWVGTVDGLNRYDGYNFKTFRHDSRNLNSVSNNSISVVYEDKSGNLWIGTLGGGVNRFDRKKENFISYIIEPYDGISAAYTYIRSIYEDRNGILLVGTDAGLFKYDRTRDVFIDFWDTTKYPAHITRNYITSIYEDNFKLLWIGTKKGLICFNKSNNQIEHYTHITNDASSLNGDWINFIIEDKSGILWIATMGGLNRFDRTKKAFKRYLTDNAILKIEQNESEILWLGSNRGLIKFDKVNEKLITYLADHPIYSFFIDDSGILWCSTLRKGLYKYDNRKERFRKSNSFTNIEILNGKSILSVYEDKSGKLWVGVKDEGLYEFDRDKQRFSFYEHIPNDPTSLSNNNINSIVEDKDETLWIGTFNGLNKFDKTRKQLIHYLHSPNDSTSLSHRLVQSILIDNSGRLWIGTQNGLNRLDGTHNKFIRYSPRIEELKKSSGDIIFSLYEDTQNYLWVGTGYGVYKINQEKGDFIRFVNDLNDFSSISDNSIRSIYEDKEGDVWICTQGGGLNKFNRETESFDYYRSTDGIPSEVVLDILEDEHHNLWISSDNGLTKFNKKNKTLKNYCAEDGLISNKFTFRAACKSETGEMYFGTDKGLVIFHPDSIKDNTYIPPVVLTDFLLFNKSVPIGMDTVSNRIVLNESIIETKELKLTYEDNLISFEFAALDFHIPEKNKYAYFMEGFDNDWNYTDANKRFATYTNLDPGEYTFKVKGANNDGIWNEAGTSLKIIITPPWWSTWWAYTLYVLFGIGLLYSLRRYELNRTKLKNQVKLDEVKLKEREETDRIKSRFFANISHEFRTPLTLILGPSESIAAESKEEDTRKKASTIKRNANRLLGLINQLLDLSKLEAGKLELRASRSNIVPFIRGLTMSFESIAVKKDITLKVESSNNKIEMYFDKEKMTKIMTNLLSNAFKFTPEDGKITVSVSESENDTITIRLRDTGVGISEEELSKLFDRFYQVDSSQTREQEGTGIGLALTKELVELHHGTISVKSKLGSWTEFTITLPVGRKHLKDEEIIIDVTTEDVILSPDLVNMENTIDFDRRASLTQTPQNNIEFKEDRNIILIVEDNVDVREFIKDSLGDEFQIEEAPNGEIGLKKAREIIPDLIISDIMMPQMDGNELTKRIKINEKTSHIPIILLTAKSEQQSKLKGLEIGADDYLTKPFDRKELRVRINNLISIRRKLQEKYGKGDFLPGKRTEEKKLSDLDEKFMAKVMEVIENHLSEEEFSSEQLAKELYMSRMQLHRKLKALTGKSSSLFVRSVKLKKAKKMIEENQGNVSEIAYSVGFSSPAYFTKCFKEEFGVPPSDLVS